MAAPASVVPIAPVAKPRPTYNLELRPDEVFARNGPLGARADVQVITSDGQTLWLHRVVLELWSSLFHDLIVASEEHLDFTDRSSSPQVVSITVTDTAADLMLLLSCLYPAAHHPDRRQGSTLDAASFLPLLGLADKYHCPHIIQRCAAFAVEHVLPRLAASSSAAAAAEYLQLSPPPQLANGSGIDPWITVVVEWVVRCLELAARLELHELVEGTATLLGERIFEWSLQAGAHRDALTRVARVLPPDRFVDLVVGSIPNPHSASVKTESRAAKTVPGRRNNVAVGGAAAAGGGPRIVPVVVAAAGPAAAVAPLMGPAPVGAPAAPHPPQQPQHPQPQPVAPQPFMEPQQHQLAGNHPQQQLANAFWQAFNMQGGGLANGMPPQPEPLLGPGRAGW